MSNTRVGLGFDVHKFTAKRKGLILGGAVIPCNFGIEAVSDGDVVLHAIADSICGATGLGDIGDFFPPQDKKNINLDSKKIINFILNKINKQFKIVNIDITIIAEKPKLVSYKEDIVKSLKTIFSLSDLNVKIKSKEGLNILGGVNAISCLAVALIKKR